VPNGRGGRTVVYLGQYDSDESRQKYARLIAEMAATPTKVLGPAADRAVTVHEVLLAFWHYAEGHYRRADGSTTDELPQYRQTFRLVKQLYGRTLAAEFGPRALKTLRQAMSEWPGPETTSRCRTGT
jgi:hypothetical protein